MGAKRNIDMTKTTEKIKIVKSEDQDQKTAVASDSKKDSSIAKKSKQRSKKYASSRSIIDKSKAYSPSEAVQLILKASYAKFVGSIVADVICKDIGDQAKLTFPHSTGKKIKVAIASEELIKDIAAGKIEFDVLLSKPEFIPKLAKYAKILGPKGLMPNPKNGTITQNPEKTKESLEKGSFTVKTERKAPLAHIVIGNSKMKSEELVANLEALITSLQYKLVKLYLSATMSPSVRVKFE